MTKQIRYEDAAERCVMRTSAIDGAGVERPCEARDVVMGWRCKACLEFFGHEAHARYCCGHRDRACETEGCSGRRDSPYVICKGCRSKSDLERWENRYREHAVEWDGETPLYSEAYDRWLFPENDGSVEELRATLGEWEVCPGHTDDCPLNIDRVERVFKDGAWRHFVTPSLEELRLVLAEPYDPPAFKLVDLVRDYMPDEADDYPWDDGEARAVEKVVNDFLGKHSPFSWQPTGGPVKVESLKEKSA